MQDQISLRIIFADKKFDIGEIKSTENIFLLKTIIKNSLLSSKEKFEPDVEKSLKNLSEDRIKLKVGFPPVTIEGKEHDSKKLNDMKISNNELIRVELSESLGNENVNHAVQDNKSMNTSIKLKENNSEGNNDPIDYSKYSVRRKIIPADNSCLFNAVNYALNQNLSEPEIMRSLIAAEIQSNMDFYNSAILDGKDPYDYCDWIMRDTTWGGGIEISILCKCFQISIGVVDAVHNTIEFLGENYTNVIFLLYDGIHYDLFVREVDGKESGVFMSNDLNVKQEVLSIAKELNAAKKFVDTTKYSIRCNVCYTNLKGSEDAVKHSKATGHVNFVQIGN